MDKKQLQKILSHPFFVVIVTIVSLISIFSLQKSSKQALISKESIEKLEKSVAETEKELLKEQKKMNENQAEVSLEKIKRNELLLKKENDIILQIPDEESFNSQLDKNTTIKQNQPINEWKNLFIDTK